MQTEADLKEKAKYQGHSVETMESINKELDEADQEIKPKSIGGNLSRKAKRAAERFLKKNERQIDKLYDAELEKHEIEHKKEGTRYWFPDQETVNKSTIIRQNIAYQYLKDHYSGLTFKEKED